ncbi:MAG: response regulator [Gemmataceae bacterium]
MLPTNARILVVDDDPDVRRVTTMMLRQGGYSFVEASSGQEALEILRQYPKEFILLISDLKMPEMDGEQLAREAFLIVPQIKVLFVTGYSGDAVAAMHLKPDQISILEKPFTLEELLNQVGSILRERE